MKSDPAIRAEIVAAAAGAALNSLYVGIRKGRIPPPDAVIRRKQAGGPARGWKLSTIARWRPDVAARCQGIHAVIQAHELTAA